MPDYFALLNEPRRPWLDADLLKQKFLALAPTLIPTAFTTPAKRKKRQPRSVTRN